MREFRFVITPFCNYKCFFCHKENVDEDVSLLLRPCDYEFIAEVGRNHMGWTTATITGGEPFISPIYKDVVNALKELGIAVTVVTNASLLARPQEMLKDIAQINISLHTLDPEIYREIVGVKYPLASILNTIVATRAALPDLLIHLNYTVVKGMNDKESDFEKILEFAKQIKAEAKFIDLSTTNERLITNADNIVTQLERMGFKIIKSNCWKYRLIRGEEETTVTKCPFNGKYDNIPARDIFVDPNGTLYKSYGGCLSINALNDIKSKDEEKLIQKVKVLLQ